MEFLNSLQAWEIWVMVGILLIIGEILGMEFILFATGTAFVFTGLATNAFDLGFTGQMITAGLLTALFVPVFMRFYRRVFKAKGTKSLVSEGIGKNVDLEVVDYSGRLGVRIQGDFYPAATTDGSDLKAGDWVRLVEMRGVTAYVEQI
ncbi:MAG: NfeD family protein [Gammaproteobacteria bacterium]|nr:NfeD family protein [Gammaproteobacteria bacterium]